MHGESGHRRLPDDWAFLSSSESNGSNESIPAKFVSVVAFRLSSLPAFGRRTTRIFNRDNGSEGDVGDCRRQVNFIQTLIPLLLRKLLSSET